MNRHLAKSPLPTAEPPIVGAPARSPSHTLPGILPCALLGCSLLLVSIGGCRGKPAASPDLATAKAATPAPIGPVALETRLLREVGAGGPVAVVVRQQGLFALSRDGARRQALVEGSVTWAHVDARGRHIWYGFVEGGEGRVGALDLDGLDATPVIVATKLPPDEPVSIVYSQGKGQERLGLRDSIDSSGFHLFADAKHPRIKYEAGTDGEGEEGGEDRGKAARAARAARLTPAGRQLLVESARRGAGRHTQAMLPKPSQERVDAVDPSQCEEAALCGGVEPFGASPFWRVLVRHSCGDACHVNYQLYDPRTGEFVDYRDPKKRAKRPDPDAPPLTETWIAPDGSAFLVDGTIWDFAGHGVASDREDGGGGGGWLGEAAHLN